MWGKLASYGVANKWKKSTGLPANIWIDENQTYKLGWHSKHIKFQAAFDLYIGLSSTGGPMTMKEAIHCLKEAHKEELSRLSAKARTSELADLLARYRMAYPDESAAWSAQYT